MIWRKLLNFSYSIIMKYSNIKMTGIFHPIGYWIVWLLYLYTVKRPYLCIDVLMIKAVYIPYICMLDAYIPSITLQIVLLWCFVFCSFHRMLYIFHVETVVHVFIIILMLYHTYASVRPVLCFSSINLSNLSYNTGFSTPWPHFADNQQIC